MRGKLLFPTQPPLRPWAEGVPLYSWEKVGFQAPCRPWLIPPWLGGEEAHRCSHVHILPTWRGEALLLLSGFQSSSSLLSCIWCQKEWRGEREPLYLWVQMQILKVPPDRLVFCYHLRVGWLWGAPPHSCVREVWAQYSGLCSQSCKWGHIFFCGV